MSANATALIAGTILAVGALAFVLYPLFFADDPARRVSRAPTETKDSAITALREIEFDRATGKLSDSDYAELKATYATQALAELRLADGSTVAAEAIDPVEARVRAYRMARKECRTCGLRPEPDAAYCSTCGSYLDGSCPGCGAVVGEAGAVFCSHCGATLAQARERVLA